MVGFVSHLQCLHYLTSQSSSVVSSFWSLGLKSSPLSLIEDPSALWALTAAVCLYPAMFVIGWVIPYDLKDDEILRQFAGALFSIASFGLVISSMVLLRRDLLPQEA